MQTNIFPSVQKGTERGREMKEVNETFLPHFISFEHLSFFNFTFLRSSWKLKTFWKLEFVEQESKVSCYHFQEHVLWSLFSRNFPSIYSTLFETFCEGSEWRKKIEYHREWNWWFQNWTSFVCCHRCDILKTNQILILNNIVQVDIVFCSSSTERLPSINLILKYINEQHWYSICVFAIWRKVFILCLLSGFHI